MKHLLPLLLIVILLFYSCSKKPPVEPEYVITNTPIDTETYTETPTFTPTGTDVFTFTETYTETSTETNTLSPTLTPTFTYTPTIIVTTDLLVIDDFEDGDLFNMTDPEKSWLGITQGSNSSIVTNWAINPGNGTRSLKIDVTVTGDSNPMNEDYIGFYTWISVYTVTNYNGVKVLYSKEPDSKRIEFKVAITSSCGAACPPTPMYEIFDTNSDNCDAGVWYMKSSPTIINNQPNQIYFQINVYDLQPGEIYNVTLYIDDLELYAQ